MRVLVAGNLDSERPFGQFRRPFQLARALAARGVEVGVVGLDCRLVDFGPTWSTGEQSLRRLGGAIRAAQRRFAPDVVYAHQNMPAAAAVLSAGVPVVADMHAVASAEWATFARHATGAESVRCRLRQARAIAVENLVVRRASRVVAAGPEVARRLAGVAHARHPPAVVLNGVELEMLEASDPPVPAALAEDGPHAVAVLPVEAWPANEQALDLLLEAARELSDVLPEARVHVVGTAGGPAAPGVTYHGFVDSLLPWLHHADACLLPYPATAGGAGGARSKLLEYLARGRLVVTTREGLTGLGESAAWPGVVLAPDDAPGYARALAHAMTNGTPRLDEARADVRRLRWDVLAVDVERILREAAGA